MFKDDSYFFSGMAPNILQFQFDQASLMPVPWDPSSFPAFAYGIDILSDSLAQLRLFLAVFLDIVTQVDDLFLVGVVGRVEFLV